MRTIGNAMTGGVYNSTPPDLPHADGRPPAHRPWCTVCKVKHDPDQLDQDGRCPRCAAAALRRAEADARRAADPHADDVWTAAQAAFRKQHTGRRTTTTTTRRSRRTGPNERIPGSSTPTAPAPKTARPRRVDNTARITRLEQRATKLRAQLADLTRQLAELRDQHDTERTPTERRPHDGPRQPRRDKLDLPAAPIIEAYTAGATMSELAEQHGCTPPTIRRLLLEHDVPTRDKRIHYTPELLERVRAAYVDRNLTTTEAAEELGVSAKVVTTALRLAGVELRPAAPRQPRDGSRNVKDQLTALGVTSRDVKAWGIAHGHLTELRRGIPSAALVDAYAAAHQAAS